MRLTFTKRTFPNLTNLIKFERSLRNDDDELFWWYGWLTEGFRPYFQPEPLTGILASRMYFQYSQFYIFNNCH